MPSRRDSSENEHGSAAMNTAPEISAIFSAEAAQKGVNEEDFERTKKMIYGEYVKEYDDVVNISRMFLSDYFKGINSFDYLE